MKDFFLGFEHPRLLWAALPVFLLLLALYLLHRRSKTRIVSAIFLWDRPERSPNSGTKLKFRLPPPIFYLELAILLLLTAALAAPFLATPETYPPLAVILDDSMSMQAKRPGGKSPLEAGTEFLRDELKGQPDRRVLWILAGERAGTVSDSNAHEDFTRFWSANAGSADLAAAVSLARQKAQGCEILIATDRKPEFGLAPDTAWFAAGEPLPNTAIVNAHRSTGRISIEAANFSDAPADAVLVTDPGERRQIRLAPKEIRRFVLPVPPGHVGAPVKIRLENTSGNDLSCDDEVVLEPGDDAPVSCRIADSLPAAAKDTLRLVLENNPDFRLASPGETPDLDILSAETESPAPVHLFWFAAPNAAPPDASGPLLRENDALLTRGLLLNAILWKPSVDDIPGQTLLRLGDVPVLSMRRNLSRDRQFFLNLDPVRTEDIGDAFWPAFFQNLARTVREGRFGPARANLRSGELVSVRLPRDGNNVLNVVGPDGAKTTVHAVNGQADFRPSTHGVWKLGSGRDSWEVSVMGIRAAESDLSGAGEFRCESAGLDALPYWSPAQLSWIFLLLAALLLALHQVLVARKGAPT